MFAANFRKAIFNPLKLKNFFANSVDLHGYIKSPKAIMAVVGVHTVGIGLGLKEFGTDLQELSNNPYMSEREKKFQQMRLSRDFMLNNAASLTNPYKRGRQILMEYGVQPMINHGLSNPLGMLTSVEDNTKTVMEAIIKRS